MKFKVGDKVKIINKRTINMAVRSMDKYLGTIMTITRVDNSYYKMKEDNGEWYWDDDMIEEKVQFTKSDLKDGDIVTYRSGNKRIVQGESLKTLDGNNGYELQEYRKDLTEKDNMTNFDIIKVERPVKYETIFERKEEILDEVEKRYLRDVIRPFKCKVSSITKVKGSIKDFILILMKNNERIELPYFEKGTMYEGMEADRRYTLEELKL